MSEARGVQPAGDWFAAEVDVPQDVAVLNFVVQYYEHYDNNYGVDFKAAVEVDSEGRSVTLSATATACYLHTPDSCHRCAAVYGFCNEASACVHGNGAGDHGMA